MIKELIMLGIGVHHSDLLIINKELIEILFFWTLIKVLLCTESFSMGLNMPSKTVIFIDLNKFDGNNLWNL